MNCVQDLKGYLLNELTAADRRAVERHAETCPACSEELDRLRLIQAAMAGFRDEDPPRRLAFVADTPADTPMHAPWWRRIWQSAPAMGFASAALLSAAIVTHAVYQPAPAVAPQVDIAAIEARIQREIQRETSIRLDDAVAKATASIERRSAEQSARLVAAAEQRLRTDHRTEVLMLQSSIEYLNKRANVQRVALNRDAVLGSAQPSDPRSGEVRQ